MARRRRIRSSGQKGKDGKRPRAFHRGRAQGEINERLLVSAIEPAFELAAADRRQAEARAKANRAETADWRRMIAALDHVAPFALAPGMTIGALSGVEQPGSSPGP